MLSSMQTMEEIRATEAALKNQDIKVLFVAPERLQNAYFLSFLKSIKIAFRKSSNSNIRKIRF
jgi:ATP-dependent DNA helicase RecQ